MRPAMLGNFAILVFTRCVRKKGSPLQNSGLQVHRVLEGRTPVLLLADTLSIGLGERGVMVKLRRHHT